MVERVGIKREWVDIHVVGRVEYKSEVRLGERVGLESGVSG